MAQRHCRRCTIERKLRFVELTLMCGELALFAANLCLHIFIDLCWSDAVLLVSNTDAFRHRDACGVSCGFDAERRAAGEGSVVRAGLLEGAEDHGHSMTVRWSRCEVLA